mmetsp:Transcript_17837/g.20595  ORF Transcript_17837/g.20595 Transcript_17837/m.20595 type:complete len:166 (+) Transcript_17837:73-570(+)
MEQHDDDQNAPAVKDIIKRQIHLVLTLGFLQSFVKFWKNLEDLTSKPELKQMKEHYHETYLKICWGAFFSFYIFFMLTVYVCILFIEINEELKILKYAFPFFIMFISMMDIVIQRNNKLVEHVLIAYLIVFGIQISNESILFVEYRFYEVWVFFYITFILISIAY